MAWAGKRSCLSRLISKPITCHACTWTLASAVTNQVQDSKSEHKRRADVYRTIANITAEGALQGCVQSPRSAGRRHLTWQTTGRAVPEQEGSCVPQGQQRWVGRAPGEGSGGETGAGDPDWAQCTAHQGDGHRAAAWQSSEQPLYRENPATGTRGTAPECRGCI